MELLEFIEEKSMPWTGRLFKEIDSDNSSSSSSTGTLVSVSKQDSDDGDGRAECSQAFEEKYMEIR